MSNKDKFQKPRALLGLHYDGVEELVEAVLEREGYEVDKAFDVPEILRRVEANPEGVMIYDVIVMDVNLGSGGESDGSPSRSVYTAIRGIGHSSYAKFIPVTSHPTIMQQMREIKQPGLYPIYKTEITSALPQILSGKYIK